MISIVIPLYNGEKYIEETLHDVLNNTERDLEVLVVDDGSKDSGAMLVQKVAETDSRVKYFYKENGGIAAARNYGLERATGMYVCFIDQDDVGKPDMFAVMKEDMEMTGADFVKAGATQSVNGVEEAGMSARRQTVVRKDSDVYHRYLQALAMRGVAPTPEYEVSVSIWSCLFRTELLRSNEIIFESFCDYEDDWVACIKAFRKAKVVCLESRTVYCWRVHEQSESHDRVARDRYIENFYARYCRLNTFVQAAVEETGLTDREHMVFAREMQKRAILWTLSNETGRGICGRTLPESEAVVKHVVQSERENGLYSGMIRPP